MYNEPLLPITQVHQFPMYCLICFTVPQTFCWLFYKALFGYNLYTVGLPCSSVGKQSACNAGDPGWIPGSGWSAREGIPYPLQYSWASLVAHLVKNLPAMWEAWVWSLGWEERLSIPLFWSGEFHGRYSPWGYK